MEAAQRSEASTSPRGGESPSAARGSQPEAVERAPCQLLLVGVGGQGVLSATKMLAAATHDAGLPLVVGQLHGMSQRGGTVQCSLRIGPAYHSSFIIGAVDVLLAFEPLEAQRALPQIGAETHVLLNTTRIAPQVLVQQGRPYPPLDQITASIEAACAELSIVDGGALAREVGVPRTLNVALLGALARFAALPLTAEELWAGIAASSPPRYREANRRAFELGHAALASAANDTCDSEDGASPK